MARSAEAMLRNSADMILTPDQRRRSFERFLRHIPTHRLRSTRFEDHFPGA